MAAPENVVAQLKPGAASLQTLYSPGAGRRGKVKLVAACQVAADDVRISIADDAAADSPSQYVAYDMTVTQDVPYNDEFYLEGTDVIRVYSTGGNVSFLANAFEDDIPSA